jgi:hypothetical protein
MIDARAFASAALLTTGPNAGEVLIVGGRDQHDSPQMTAELYDPAHQTFTLTGSSPPSSPNFAYFDVPATVLGDGTVLLTDGQGDAEIYDPVTSTFNVISGSGAPLACAFTSTLLSDNSTVLFTGGFEFPGCSSGSSTAATATASTETFSNGTFSNFGNMDDARGGQAAILLQSDGSVLVTGGAGSLGATLASAELLPSANQPTATRKPLAARSPAPTGAAARVAPKPMSDRPENRSPSQIDGPNRAQTDGTNLTIMPVQAPPGN